jgi:NAD(P)-dependent dehydrogenase (short-subunit alcohol dehydrogenase family)
MSSFNIENSVAFVTGTNKPNGIGRAVVEALLANGAAKVYATARDTSQLTDLVEKHNGKVEAVSLNVTDYEAVASLANKYSDVTLLVNNAGYMSGKTSIDDIDAARKEIEINYVAPMALVKSFSVNFNKLEAAADHSDKPSAVVNIASIASLVNFPAAGTYSASKAATHSLTQAQRRDLSKSLVVGVYPGPIDTDMADGFPFEKTPPSSVAQSIVDALGSGKEDVFPDPMAVQLYEGWKADAKALEQQMAQSVAA